ncbi:hypothetical protein VB715_05570 [Crocosphaera sp. UHCC 0190]|uniref:hypothetical protein n=1 Tax=Crocosphaera sp. UHCC 0190 TaxID=3110246 RepID=UPI002B1EFEBB|nr:hypothetical protein [Crocosphaera sp. UHCC 0190]MEA5509229.1 hypothetical protein [Crocosphaera sp. UHCC 0190]
MSSLLIFKGKVLYLTNHWYANLIFPLVQVKKLLQTIYYFILHLIWSELIHGNKLDNEIAHLIAFLLFCSLSLGIYYLKNYNQLIILIFLGIYYLDRWISQHQYLRQNHQVNVTLVQSNSERIIWTLSLPKNQLKSKFLNNQVNYISLGKFSVFGGAFQEVLGEIWRIEICLYDGNSLIIDEQKSLDLAMELAKKMADYFKVKIQIQKTQGNNQYAEQSFDMQSLYSWMRQNKLSIKCQKNAQKWHIYSQWQWANSWILIKQVFQKAGFFLFLLIMSKFMIQFGELLNNIIAAFQGQDVIIYFPSPLEWFKPNWNWRNGLALTIALGIMVYQGWQLSRVKHIYLDKYYLKFFIDNQLMNKIKISDIETTLLINNDEPEILIFSPKKTIHISQFQEESNAQAFWGYLDQGINFFQGNSSLN